MSQEGVDSKISIFSDNFRPLHTLKYQEVGNALKTLFRAHRKVVKNHHGSDKAFMGKRSTNCLLTNEPRKGTVSAPQIGPQRPPPHQERLADRQSQSRKVRENKVDFVFFVIKS